MTRIPRNPQIHQMSDSWDNMEASQNELTFSSSEDEFRPRLQDAYRSSHLPASHSQNPAQPSSSRYRKPSSRYNIQPSSEETQFIMPSPESSEYLDSRSGFFSKQSPTKKSAPAQRLSPRKRTDPASIRPNRRRDGVKKSSPRGWDSTEGSGDYLHLFWSNLLRPLLGYVLSIFFIAANAMKPLLGFALIVLLIASAFVPMKTLAIRSAYATLSPLCQIPGAGYLNLPFCTNPPKSDRGVVEFDKLVVAQSNIEGIHELSIAQAALPIAMKNTQSYMRDLRAQVDVSNLSTKHELLNEFDGFIETARMAADGLSDFNSRVGRTLDGIIAANRHTVRELASIGATREYEGFVPRFVSQFLPIFSPHFSVPRKSAEDTLYEQYLRHAQEVEVEIQLSLAEGEALTAVLNNLDERLGYIGGIVAREDNKVTVSKEELLSMLWTKFGANRGEIARHEKQLATLQMVTKYRAMAMSQVDTAVMKLRDIENNLASLREEVAKPSVVGRENVPLQMHIDLVSSAVDRLQNIRDDGRKKTMDMHQGTIKQVENHWNEHNKIGYDARREIGYM